MDGDGVPLHLTAEQKELEVRWEKGAGNLSQKEPRSVQHDWFKRYRLYDMLRELGEAITPDLLHAYGLDGEDCDRRLSELEEALWEFESKFPDTVCGDVGRYLEAGKSERAALFLVAAEHSIPSTSFEGAFKKVKRIFDARKALPAADPNLPPAFRHFGVLKDPLRIRVAPGRRVLDPDNNWRSLSSERTYTVPNSLHWRLRLRAGDIEIVD